MSIGLAAIIIVSMLAIPAYLALFWTKRRRIHFTSGLTVFLGREMLLVGGLTMLPAYLVSIYVFNLWIGPRLGFGQASMWTPLRCLLNSNAISNSPPARYETWAWIFVIFYALCAAWSGLWVWLLAWALLTRKIGWLSELLEQLGLWDQTTQMLHFTSDKDLSVWIDLSQKDDGSTVYVGKLAGFVDQGPFQGITLERAYILRFADGKAKPSYKTSQGGLLLRMFFVKEKITNLHFRPSPPGLVEDQSDALKKRLEAIEASATE